MTQPQTLGFQTEVKQLLHLMIHSLYSNPDIFLRELISNASDALDKLRFLSTAHPSSYPSDKALEIKIAVDSKNHILTISDSGIGMSYDEVIENLGTIAKSGTKEFISTLSGDQNKDMSLIGQFGVGFYSAFMVADEVTVYTRKAGTAVSEGVKWSSTGDGQFQIESLPRKDSGTEIILHLRPKCYEYANFWRLQSIIQQYSNHILFPIFLEQESNENEGQTELKQINSTQALWTRPKTEITAEEYQTFYQAITHAHHPALDWIHYHAEGKTQYTALLYIPAEQTPDLFKQDQANGLKLFVERVFIMDHAALLPQYLRFIKGIIDSSDLPLNISREILQSNPLTEKIKTGLTKKILQTLKSMANKNPETYQKFWNQFGIILKEGFTEGIQNHEELSELLRFSSTHLNQIEQTISLKSYLERMPTEQTCIYYIIADQFITAQNSPHLEIFREQGIEVLLLSDRVDEWMMAYLQEYEGKKFQSITKGDLNLNTLEKSTEEKEPKKEEDLSFLLESMQKALEKEVTAVRLSKRLKDSPACLISDKDGLSLHLQRLMKDSGHLMPQGSPVLEINPKHPLIMKLLNISDQEILKEWSEFLYDQALLSEGGQLKNPALFVKKMNNFIQSGVLKQEK